MSRFLDNRIADFVVALHDDPMLFRELNKNYRGRHIVKKYSEDTCDSYEDILLTKGGLFPIYPFLDIIVLPKRTKLTSKICDNFQ